MVIDIRSFYCRRGMGNRVSPGCDFVSHATDIARREGMHEREPRFPLIKKSTGAPQNPGAFTNEP